MRGRGIRGVCTIAATILFAALIVIGLFREWRLTSLTAHLRAGLSSVGDEATFAEATARVYRHFMTFRNPKPDDPVGTALPFPLGTEADNILTGGGCSCGETSGALGIVFRQMGQDFRIIQINVVNGGPSHIMVEAKASSGRWALLDPTTGMVFRHPGDGHLMSIEEVQALDESARATLPEYYRTEWSLFGPYRRTNWERIPWLRTLVKLFVRNEEKFKQISLRAMLIEPGAGLVWFGAGGLALVAFLRFGRMRRKAPAALQPTA